MRPRPTGISKITGSGWEVWEWWCRDCLTCSRMAYRSADEARTALAVHTDSGHQCGSVDVDRAIHTLRAEIKANGLDDQQRAALRLLADT